MFKLYPTILLVFVLLFSSCVTTKQHIADADVTYLRANDDIKSDDAAMDKMIATYRDQMEDEMNIVLGEMPETIKKSRPHSSLSNWFCDGQLVMSNKYSKKPVDFAVQNYGGFRIPSIPKGPVTKRHIFELMPFDNKLVILELDGAAIQQFADHMAEDEGWPISTGFTFTIKEGKAVDVEVGGKKLDMQKVYRIGVPDYVANGGGGCWFLKEVPQMDTGKFIREIMIEYLEDLQKAGQPITVDKSKRFKS